MVDGALWRHERACPGVVVMPSGTIDEAFRAAVHEALRLALPAVLHEVLPAVFRELLVDQASGEVRDPVTDGDLLTVEKVAAILDVSKPTVRRWIQTGVLPACYVGPRRLVRVQRADVERFLISGRQHAQSAPASDLDAEAAKIVACARPRPRKNERAPRTRPAAPHQTGE